MKVKTTTTTTHSITLDDNTELELPLKPTELIDYKPPIVHRTEDEIVLGYLADDDWGRGYYFDEFEEGQFYNLGMSRLAPPVTKEDPRELYERLCQENPGRVFRVDCYQHGLVNFSLSSEGPNCQWDTARGAFIYVAPEDASNPEEYARSTMREYTDWCNGRIYGMVIVSYEKQEDGTWEMGDHEASWGMIGDDYAYEELQREMRATTKEESSAEA